MLRGQCLGTGEFRKISSLSLSKYTATNSLQIELVNMLIYYPEVFKIYVILKWKIHKHPNRKFSLSYSLSVFVWDL